MTLLVYGNGQNIRDWIHVTDHCRAIDLIVHSGSPGEVYNIGGNHSVVSRTLVILPNYLSLLYRTIC